MEAGSQESVQWQVCVSQDTDVEVKEYLRAQQRQSIDISSLVEDAVRMYLFQRTIQDIQARNADTSTEELEALADAAVRSVRREMALERV